MLLLAILLPQTKWCQEWSSREGEGWGGESIQKKCEKDEYEKAMQKNEEKEITTESFEGLQKGQ